MENMKPLEGKEILYLLQPINAPVGADAMLPGVPTEGSWTREKENNSVSTKVGSFSSSGAKEESFEVTFLALPADAGQEALDWSYENDKLIKVWRVEKRLNAEGLHPARFAYCDVSNLESSDGDEFVENTTTLPVMMNSTKGAIPELPESIWALGQYDFEAPGETGVAPETTP